MLSADYSMIQRSQEPRAESLDDNQHHQLLMNVGDAHQGSDYPFPVKLHFMLHDAEKRGLDDLVSWLPNGNGFIIHKPKEAAKHVLSIWFRQKCYGSFQRQLNLYNFTRIKSGGDKGGYCHELFVRGQPALSYGMRRVPIKNATRQNPEIFLKYYRNQVASFLNMNTDDANTTGGLLCASQNANKPLETLSSTIGSSPQCLQSSLANMDQRKEVSCVEGTRGGASSSFAVPDVISSNMMKPPLINQNALCLSSLLEPQSRSRQDQSQGDAGQQCTTTAKSRPSTALQPRFPQTTATTMVGMMPHCSSFPSLPSPASLLSMDYGPEDEQTLPSLAQPSQDHQQQQRRRSSHLLLRDLTKDMEASVDFDSNRNCAPCFHDDHSTDAVYGQRSTNQESWAVVCSAAFSEPEMRAQIIQMFLC